MNEALIQTLKLCEKSAAWFGVHIHSLDQRNNLNDTPLHTVCSWGELAPVKVLIKYGADVNACGDIGATPIFNAVIGGNAEVVKFLIQSGANLSIKNNTGRSVINYAKNISASEDIIGLLLGR